MAFHVHGIRQSVRLAGSAEGIVRGPAVDPRIRIAAALRHDGMLMVGG
jgi:hypothetical protein